MAEFTGKPAPINRFLGYLDADDVTNLPVGLAGVARNSTYDQTSARTRDGFQKTMQGVNKAPITGLLGMIYLPETASDVGFQMPIAFDTKGAFQYESPLGSGQMAQVESSTFTPPLASHMIAVETYNLAYAAFSNLGSPTSQVGVFNPKTKNLDPYGMKQYGWNWLPSTACVVGEMATPSTFQGNGHTYRCTQSGITAQFEPTWPTTEAATVTDGGVIWKEYTAVMANRIPAPPAPVLTRDAAAGTFAAGRDVYIILTWQNAMGETVTSPSSVLLNTVANDGVSVAILPLASLPGWISQLGSYAITNARVYEADVAHGATAPPLMDYEFVSNAALNSAYVVTTTATSGVFPPSLNSARITPGQLPTPIDEVVITRESSSGSFAAGRDVYVLQTYQNTLGETPAGPTNNIIDTLASDAVGVTIAAPEDFPQITSIGIYEADVPTGTPAPPSSAFALVGYFAPGTTATITDSAGGPPPPIVNGTGPAGNIVADTLTGGLNGTQGYRYAALMYMNRNYSVSGFTASSVIQYDVDEDGWQLSIFNVSTGPANVIARPVAFTVADGTSAGDFWWIGNINPQVPSQNFVYPQTTLDDGIQQSATVFYDNVRTTGTFNFTDEYLDAANLVTDRLDILWPAPCVHIAYHESIDRIIQCGVPGNAGGCRLSNAGAPEDYYADTCDVVVQGSERSWGTFEFRSQIWLARSLSGGVLSPVGDNPNQWKFSRRWKNKGPCGPRAFDSSDDFFCFIHRSGMYRYDETNPDLMSKEIPYFWNTINWAAGHTIVCRIDSETHEVHVLAPVGNSTVPNCRIVWNWKEGWQNPIHFSTYSGREISMDACRKVSIDDCAAFVCERLERVLPVPPGLLDQGVTNIPTTGPSFYQSQLCFGSAGSDGFINAVQPGVFNDNGEGIDWQYQTVCPQQSMGLGQIEGVLLNAVGSGPIQVHFVAALHDLDSDQKPGFFHYPAETINLVPNQSQGISLNTELRINERWSVMFSNGKQPNVWARLKWAAIYTTDAFATRGETDLSQGTI